MNESIGYKLGRMPKLHLTWNKGDKKAICGAKKNLKFNFNPETEWAFACKKCHCILYEAQTNNPY